MDKNLMRYVWQDCLTAANDYLPQILALPPAPG